jgi:hypothetical protein
MTTTNRALIAATLLFLPALTGANGTGCGDDEIPIGSGSGGGGTVEDCLPEDCGPPLGIPNYACSDGSTGGPTGACILIDGACGWEIHECPPDNLQWYTSCGDPVCQSPDVDDPNVPNCTTEMVGDACSNADAFCEVPGDSCGTMLLCTDSDPAVMCPISRASYKTGISYLDDRDVERLYSDLLTMRMARWHYSGEPSATRPHLGFIIDDQPDSPAVAASGERVDLYGYTSMAAAAIQVQARQIETLEREIQLLRESVTSSCR